MLKQMHINKHSSKSIFSSNIYIDITFIIKPTKIKKQANIDYSPTDSDSSNL